MSIYEDSENNLWIGSYTKGIATVDRHTGKCNYLEVLDVFGKKVQRVFAITEDDNKRLWIGSMGTGLLYYDLNTKKAIYPKDINKDNRWITCVLYSKKEKKLYAGNFDGINCIDINGKNFKNTLYLRKHIVYSLYEDNDGNIWAGTTSGLINVDTKTNRMYYYTTKDGLAGNTVYAIQGDKDGSLWISTNDGLSQFNTKTHHCTNFYMGDGLQGNEFYKNSSMKDSDGTLWFGGVNGITYFNPKNISTYKTKIDIRITDFYLNNKPVRKGTLSDGKNIIDCPVFEAKDFYLSHNDNSFSIEFSCIEMNNPERMRYMYSLNGEDWTSLPLGTNRASLVNIAPGTYTFMVKAINNSNESNTVKVNIHIASPWWKTWIAYSSYALVIIFTILYIVRIRINKFHIKQEMLKHIHSEEINEAKLQFFINISHEIRTPMSLIISPLQRLIENDNDNQRQKIYNIIYNNSQRILRLINQLMDIRKIDKGLMSLSFKKTDISLFINNICDFFSQEAESKNIKITLYESDIINEDVWVDPTYFDKIIVNLLSNAIKYTPEHGNIDIFISKGDDVTSQAPLNHFVEIIIADNGIGIPQNEIEHIFERFYQIRNNTNNANIGTGIGLHLTLSLIKLHHATINVISNTTDYKGTKFIIHLPIGKTHLKPEDIDNTTDTTNFESVYKPFIYPKLSYQKEKTKKRINTRYKVLIVDDDDEIRNYLSEEMNSEYHIIESKNGKEALDLIFKVKPNLIISDIMMPEIDGISLCRKIKQNVTLSHIPVILLTARTKEEDNIYALENGADSYIIKPFNIEILKKTVYNLIHSRESLKAQIYDQNTKEKEMAKLKVDSPDDKLMQRIMKSINYNIGNSNFSIEDLSKDVGISRVHLHRKLKELTNQTTRDFIRNIRLKQAALLLSEKRYTINEIASFLGFSNANNFSTCFKELYGVTPTEYMESELAKKDKQL